MQNDTAKRVDSEKINSLILSVDTLKKLVNSTPDEAMNDLKEYYNQYLKLQKCEKTNNPKNNENDHKKIIESVSSAHDIILNLTDINDIKSIVQELIDIHMKLMESFIGTQEELKLEMKNQSKEFLYGTMYNYMQILGSDNLDYIKQSISEIKQNYCNYLFYIMNYKEKSKKQLSNNKKKIIKVKIPFDVQKAKAYLDEKIIGQEQAKKDIISSIFMNKLENNPETKRTCFLIGPSGSGKTLIIDTLSKYLNIPSIKIDSTQLTAPSFSGANIEDFLVRLINVAGGDIEKAQNGIVNFDEIDKKGTDKDHASYGKAVLDSLLSFIEGTTYNVKYQNETILFDTSNLTVCMTGAFTNVFDELKEQAKKSKSIGFLDDFVEDENLSTPKIQVEDLKKYGNIPVEFFGRTSTIVQLEEHTKETLKEILLNPGSSVLINEKKSLNNIKINLSWNEKYLDAVSEQALDYGTGARSLKTIVEKTIMNARWEVLNNLGTYCGIILNEKVVEDSNEAVLVCRDGSYITVNDAQKQSKNNSNYVKKK